MPRSTNKMKAALIRDFGGIDQVEIDDIEIPKLGENDILIAVSFAGVNPVDWKICEGRFKDRMGYRFPITLGWDVAGVVSAKGLNVKKFKEGEPIFAYCRKDIIHEGSFAEFMRISAEQTVYKPQSLTFAEASSVPLSALTAWQSLYDTANLQAKDTVLIHAGAGGVGTFAIQLAKLAGAHVITTARKSNTDYVKKLGADEVIDYTQEDFVNAIHDAHPEGVDIVFDTVGGKTLRDSYRVAKIGGHLVTIAGAVDQALAEERNLNANYVFVAPNQKQLQEIADLFDSKKMIPPHIHEMSLEDVTTALKKSQEGHTQGKIVLKIN